jgi:hypothetical protein
MVRRAQNDLRQALKEIGPLGTVIGAVLGAGILYVIGGTVVLVRLHQADLPVEQGLDVISREQLLLVGAREAIVVLALSVGIISLLKLKRRVLTFGILACAALFFAPLTPAGIAWPVVILLALALWLALEKKASTQWALLIIPILVLMAAVLRYYDPPSRFAEGHIWTKDPANRFCRRIYFYPDKTQPAISITASYCGAFMSVNDDNVYVAWRAGAARAENPPEILGVPKASVQRFVLTDPVDPRAPRPSLFGRVTREFGWSAISCNPLECWIGSRNVGSRIFG